MWHWTEAAHGSADGEAVRGVATETGVHLCWPNRGQTKRRVGRTVRFVLHNNFVMGIKYNSLADLNGQTLSWCNKANGKVHATSNEIPFAQLKSD